MEINEKKKKKEQQEVIIRKYQQYLKLEKSLSPNTLDAYLTDLYKLINFLEQEKVGILDVCLSDLQHFAVITRYWHSPPFTGPHLIRNQIILPFSHY